MRAGGVSRDRAPRFQRCDDDLNDGPKSGGHGCPSGHFCGPCGSLCGVELLSGKRRRMVHLALSELLFEFLPGRLALAGCVKHLGFEIAAG
jgi:hypothetical protein